MSGPACTPSSRNIRAAGSLSWRQDQENTSRTLLAASSVRSASSRPSSLRSSAASVASGKPGRAAARAAAIARASGSPAHSPASSVAASGSAITRWAPSRRTSSSQASASESTSKLSGYAPSVATRPVSRLRLVMSTGQPEWPGSSGRTWSASATLSSRTSIRWPASRLRYRAACASTDSGICPDGTCMARSRPRSALAGATGRPFGPNPRRLT